MISEYISLEINKYILYMSEENKNDLRMFIALQIDYNYVMDII